MGLGRTNKRKGSNAERYYRTIFKEIGFTHCETSRFASKLHDNSKIDLVNIPFNIQIKAGKQQGLSPGKELFFLVSSMKAMFPPEDLVFTKPNLLIHYKQGIPGKKRLPEDEMVYMSEKQFNLFKQMCPDLEYTFMKEYKFDLQSEFKSIVGMTFESFKDKIILKHYTYVDSNTTEGN